MLEKVCIILCWKKSYNKKKLLSFFPFVSLHPSGKHWKLHWRFFFFLFVLLSSSWQSLQVHDPPLVHHNGVLKCHPAVILSDSSFSLCLWSWQPVTVRRGTQPKVMYKRSFFQSLSLTKMALFQCNGSYQVAVWSTHHLSNDISQ